MINLINKKFNRLKVMKFSGTDEYRQALWLCKCDCGNFKIIKSYYLRSGHTKSCGCLCKEIVGKMFRTHGMSKTKEFTAWVGMRGRCLNKNNKGFKNYGGRGIRVCKRWEKFENFYKDMKSCPIGKSIERIDNSKGYSPSNCKWATNPEQARNTRKNRWITIDETKKLLCDWKKIKNLSRYMILKKYGP